MQVGMLASNGLVLASDTKCSRDSLMLDGLTADDDYGCSKIRIHDSGRMAVTCARDMIAANKLAETLFTELRPECWENPERYIREIGRNTMTAIDPNLDIECLIGLSTHPASLFKFQYARGGKDILSDRILTYAHTGHALNAAIFWSLRHYTIRPVRNLVTLASVLIADAAAINSARIGGLEVVYGDFNGFHRYTLEENRKLESEAKRLSKKVGSQALRPFSVSSTVL